MKKIQFGAALSAVVLASMVFASCSKDDDMKPSTGSMRTLTVENIVAPKLFVESGAFKNTGKYLPSFNPERASASSLRLAKGRH